MDLQRRIDAVYIDKLDDNISQIKYDELTMLWRNEQAENRQKKEQHEKANVNYFELGSKLLEVSKNAKNIYNRRSDDEKRQLMSLIFSNLTLKNKILSKTYSKPFAIVAERVKSNNMSGRRESNPVKLPLPESGVPPLHYVPKKKIHIILADFRVLPVLFTSRASKSSSAF